MYEVRFKGRWRGALADAFDDFEPREDGGEMVLAVQDHPALVGLMNRASEFGIVVETVTRIDDVTPHGDTTTELDP